MYFRLMTIEEATNELINSPHFKDCAKARTKEGARLRMFRIRFKRGELSTGACIEMLEYFNYSIHFDIVRKPDILKEGCDES